MKVYVDELPKCCAECPCNNCDTEYGYYCNLRAFDKLYFEDDEEFDPSNERHKGCPLQLLPVSKLPESYQQVKWYKLKEYLDNFLNEDTWRNKYEDEFAQDVLDYMEQLEKGESDE